jgi:CubicO group peptidase (beta-lactamase class C family)
MKLRLLAILLVLMAHEITAQPVFRPQKLDSLLRLLESKNKFMGSLSIRRNDQIMYQKAFGFSNIAGAEKAGTETAYRIGSISKTFTAIMVLQLVDEGKIKLCDKLEKYYPQVPNADKISMKQMLRHRSGLHNFTDSVYMTYYTQPKIRQEILSIISSYPIDFKPDSIMEYSNSNYVLLGYIIEDVTGKDYASNLRERITEPLGLQHTWFGKSAPDDLDNCKSYTYRDNEWVAEAETDLSIPHGAGAILSTPEDLTILGNALFKNQLLSEVAFTEMKRLTDNFGCGMFILPFYDRKAYGHNGSIDGFGSIWAHFPPDSVTVAMCCNGINYNMNDILIGVLSIYFDKPYTLPNFDVAQVDAKKLTDYEGTYSSRELPLKLNIFVKDGSLYGQGTGQTSFQLDAINDSTFRFDPAGLRIQFSEFSLKLNQNGKEFTMDKIY